MASELVVTFLFQNLGQNLKSDYSELATEGGGLKKKNKQTFLCLYSTKPSNILIYNQRYHFMFFSVSVCFFGRIRIMPAGKRRAWEREQRLLCACHLVCVCVCLYLRACVVCGA